MNIAPQDLGETLCTELFKQRSPKVKKKPIISVQTSASLSLFFFVGLIFSLLLQWPVTWLFLFMTLIAGGIFALGALEEYEKSKFTDWVSEYEIATLRNGVKDPLAQSYLGLIVAIRSVVTTPETTAEHEVRGAVRALGAAIDSLPPPDGEIVTENPLLLREEAARLASEGQTEKDAVIRASLLRRVDSLSRRAETAARTTMLLRRNQALREEIGEQIGALRTNLTAFRVGGEQAAHEMTGLAASIQRVTIEANAITAARAEIDSLLSEPQNNIRGVTTDCSREQSFQAQKN